MSLDRSLRARIRSCVRVYDQACARTCMHLYLRARACMHLDQCEFACVHTHKCKRSFLRACSRVGLIKMQNAFARKKLQNSNTLGSETFRMYYVYSASRRSLNKKRVQMHR